MERMKPTAPAAPTGAASVRDKPDVRIVIAAPHPMVRDGLKNLLLLEDDFEVVGEAGGGREALEQVQELGADLVLLDLQMIDGLEALEALQANQPTRVIVLTDSEHDNELMQAMKRGASGIVLKHTAPELIARCIRKVHAGEIWLDSEAMASVMRRLQGGEEAASGAKGRENTPLSAREMEVVALVAQGYKNREVAEKMFIREQTVKNHLVNIFDKLGVSDRRELTDYAIDKELHRSAEPASR